MDVRGQLHALAALLQDKEPPVPIGLEAGWAPELVRTLCRRVKSWPAGNRNRAVHPVARRYTHWATLIHLIQYFESQLLRNGNNLNFPFPLTFVIASSTRGQLRICVPVINGGNVGYRWSLWRFSFSSDRRSEWTFHYTIDTSVTFQEAQ
jgi:hypothetical protein